MFANPKLPLQELSLGGEYTMNASSAAFWDDRYPLLWPFLAVPVPEV